MPGRRAVMPEHQTEQQMLEAGTPPVSQPTIQPGA
jgi:hypothetical protein